MIPLHFRLRISTGFAPNHTSRPLDALLDDCRVRKDNILCRRSSCKVLIKTNWLVSVFSCHNIHPPKWVSKNGIINKTTHTDDVQGYALRNLLLRLVYFAPPLARIHGAHPAEDQGHSTCFVRRRGVALFIHMYTIIVSVSPTHHFLSPLCESSR